MAVVGRDGPDARRDQPERLAALVDGSDLEDHDLLKSRWAVPTALLDAGSRFTWTDLDAAVGALVGPGSARAQKPIPSR